MTPLDTADMRAGAVKWSWAWSTPTREKATPEKSTVGNNTLVREMASSVVAASE